MGAIAITYRHLVLKGDDITNYINVKHSFQEFSLFQIEIRDCENTEFGKKKPLLPVNPSIAKWKVTQ